MDNTVVDPVKGRVQVNCLYKPNLPNLGENYYGATKMIYALHSRIPDKPEVSAEIDKYINQQRKLHRDQPPTITEININSIL